MIGKKPTPLRSLFADLKGRTSVVVIFFNTLWLFSDRIIRMVVALVVGAWVARYLAPAQYGIFNNALAITTLVSAFATLGLESIVIRELVKKPDDQSAIMGTAFGLRIVAAVAMIILTVMSVSMLKTYADDIALKQLVYILSFGLLFQSFEIVDYFFQSQVKSRYTVIAKNTAYVLTSALKVFFIVGHFPLNYFGFAWTLELVFGVVGLILVYRSRGYSVRKWRFRWSWATFLVSQSWPLYVAYSASYLYMKMDQIMIGSMLDGQSAGIFAASTKLYEIPFTIIIIVSTSMYPALVQLYERDHRLFFRRYAQITWLYSALGWIVVGTTLGLGKYMIQMLYGPAYSSAYSVLSIQMIGLVFLFNAGLRSGYLAISGQQSVIMVTSLLSAGLNVALNLFLIPIFHIQGAAIATAITQMAALCLSNILFKSTRTIFNIQLKSFFLIPAWRTL